eukprot:augustus_masked-scaffold_30-processed-gene-0.6-mRNA-1 protein AED:1.00 eAED:1.00 QI:0/-1/0/0/-1/1/1/0/437
MKRGLVECQLNKKIYVAGEILSCKLSFRRIKQDLTIEFCSTEVYGECLYNSSLLPEPEVNEVSKIQNKQFDKSFLIFCSPAELICANETVIKDSKDFFYSVKLPDELFPSHDGEALSVIYYLTVEVKIVGEMEPTIKKFRVRVLPSSTICGVMQPHDLQESDYNVHSSQFSMLHKEQTQTRKDLNIIDSDFLNFSDSGYRIQYMKNKFVSSPINKKTKNGSAASVSSKDDVGQISYNIGTAGKLISRVHLHKTSFSLHETVLINFEFNSDEFFFQTVAVFVGLQQTEELANDMKPSLISAFNPLNGGNLRRQSSTSSLEEQRVLSVQTLSSEFILADDFKTKCCKFSLSELATPTVYSEWVNVKASLVLEFAFTKKENKFITDDDTNSIQCVLPIEIIKPGVFRYTDDKIETNLTSLDLEREFMVTSNKQKRRMWIP